MPYYELLTGKINLNMNKGMVITEKIIISELEKCYKYTAFSTFPYIREGLNSRQSMEKYHSGNCIALSMFIQDELKKRSIKSVLIPATIPQKYQQSGYLDISHVVLCIPVSSKEFFIVDPAFYFLNPVHVRNGKSIQPVFSKNIYNKEYSKQLTEYTSIDIINSRLNYFNETKKYNEFQIIPRHTTYVECSFKNNPNDTWKYFLREIINPDDAITSFYISIKDKPFITSTKLDENGVPSMEHYITTHQGGGKYSYNFENKIYLETGGLENLRGRLHYFFGDTLPLH